MSQSNQIILKLCRSSANSPSPNSRLSGHEMGLGAGLEFKRDVRRIHSRNLQLKLPQIWGIQYKKSWVHVYAEMRMQNTSSQIYDFVILITNGILNVADLRESEKPMTRELVSQVMIAALVPFLAITEAVHF